MTRLKLWEDPAAHGVAIPAARQAAAALQGRSVRSRALRAEAQAWLAARVASPINK